MALEKPVEQFSGHCKLMAATPRYRKQGDTIESLTTLKAEVEKAWDKALSGDSCAELTTTARALQDAIYRHWDAHLTAKQAS